MRNIEHDFELDEFLGIFDASICINVECVEGEPEVRYTRNGDGHPGSSPTVHPFKATLISLGGENYNVSRKELESFLPSAALDKLDKLALDAAHNAVDTGWLANDLFEALEAADERY